MFLIYRIIELYVNELLKGRMSKVYMPFKKLKLVKIKNAAKIIGIRSSG